MSIFCGDGGCTTCGCITTGGGNKCSDIDGVCGGDGEFLGVSCGVFGIIINF